MRYHPHGACDFIGGGDTADFALRADGSWESVLVRFKNRSLMQTDSRGVNAHVRENYVGISEAIR